MEIRPAEAVPRRDLVTELPRAAPVRLDELNSVHPGNGMAATLVAPPMPAPPAAPLQSEPLNAGVRRLHMTVSKQFLDKLEAARTGQSHAQPHANVE